MHNEIHNTIKWIKDYVVKAGAKGVVVGLSGGIDSAVVATLSAAALGKRNVLGVGLPCYSNSVDLVLADNLVSHLGIEFIVINLDDSFNQLTSDISMSRFSREAPNLASRMIQANIKARLRMTTLMALAAERGYLNAGTGNKTEIAIGYFTKFGDGGVDFEPIGDFYKTEVFEMARVIGIPDEIIDRPPTAGLWDGQTDEGELGMTYERIDAALRTIMAIRTSNSVLATAFECNPLSESELDDYTKITKLVDASEHKRHTPPIYVRSAQNSKGGQNG